MLPCATYYRSLSVSQLSEHICLSASNAGFFGECWCWRLKLWASESEWRDPLFPTERFGANPRVSSLVCRGTGPWSGEDKVQRLIRRSRASRTSATAGALQKECLPYSFFGGKKKPQNISMTISPYASVSIQLNKHLVRAWKQCLSWGFFSKSRCFHTQVLFELLRFCRFEETQLMIREPIGSLWNKCQVEITRQP